LEVVDGDRPVVLGGPKQRALLIMLLLHRGSVVPADRLIDELWGERPPRTATKTLQGYISRLRKSLGDDLLQTGGGGYVIRLPHEHLDLDRFERLVDDGRATLASGDASTAARQFRDALALWRGAPFVDVAYEPFAQAEIARLEEARLSTLEERIEAELALGRHVQLVAELESLVHEHPVRERLRGLLMLALYRTGRQADALDCYRAGRRALTDELGIEPGRALRDLEAQILRQDPVLEPPEIVTTVPGPGGGDAPDSVRADERSSEPVVGRDEQIDQLRVGLESACGGHGTVFMIGGEAGIGKTKLAGELAREARERGARVVWGRCWEVGGAPAYWPWVQVLRSLMQGRQARDLTSFYSAGARALGALISDSADPSANRNIESEGARFQLFDAVALLLAESCDQQPVLVVLDDLHAADTPSLLLLQFVAGQLEDRALMLAGLYRDEDRSEDGALSVCLAALAREHLAHRMRLVGLTAAGTAALIETITGRPVEERVTSRIHGETEGNPLFVGEIVRLLEAEGGLERSSAEAKSVVHLPETVRAVIGERLQTLTPRCRELLGKASILGREFAVREVAALTETDGDAVLESFDEAIASRILGETSSLGRFRFSHALIRDALYDTLGAAERRGAHLQAGELLEHFYASDPEPHLAELAYHFFEALPAGDPARAVDRARRAGDRAIGLLAYEEAARLYTLALRALDLQTGETEEHRCALLVALGDARARVGDEPAAKEAFLEAARIAAQAGLPILEAHAALGYGGRFVWARAYGDVNVMSLLEGALQSLPGDHSALRVKLMARLSGALRDHASRERRASLSAQAVELARALDDPATLAYALDGRYSAIMWPDTAEERLEIADEIYELAQRVGDDERSLQGRIYHALANMELGRVDEVRSELELIAAAAAALRQPAQLWMTVASQADLALFEGRFADAPALIDEALTLGERAQSRDSVLSHRLHLFMLHRETGIGDDVDTMIADGVSRFPARPAFRCALAYLQMSRGDTKPAKAAIDDLSRDDFSAIQRDNEYLFSLSLLADVAGAIGDVQAAAVLYDLLAQYGHLNASNLDEIATGSVSRPLGALAAAASRWEDAFRHFDAALAHNEEMGALPWVAHTQHDYGRALLARDESGDRKRAQEHLGAAIDTYKRLGMSPWTERVAALLRVAV
jgi:DNA-binding SARP family transcriptional activator